MIWCFCFPIFINQSYFEYNLIFSFYRFFCTYLLVLCANLPALYLSNPLRKTIFLKQVENSCVRFYLLCTVSENIIDTTKMRNDFWYYFRMFIFPMLRKQYWTFIYWTHFVIALTTLKWQKFSFLILLFKFLYRFCRLVNGFFSVLLLI